MINCLIIDDEKDARFILRNTLERRFSDQLKVLAETDGVATGIEAINEHKPDLVFLDIQMPDGTGFDLLSAFDQLDFEVIFITAYNKYAIRAFQCSAFGYIMKPIKFEELNNTLKRLTEKINLAKANSDRRFKVLIENYGDDHKIKKLVITSMEGFKVFPIEEIIRLEGERNYTAFILTNDRKILASKNLGEYEELLTEFGFFRIHQSTIVNLRHVTGYTKGDGGMVEMLDGASLKVSRYRKQAFVKRFM